MLNSTVSILNYINVLIIELKMSKQIKAINTFLHSLFRKINQGQKKGKKREKTMMTQSKILKY